MSVEIRSYRAVFDLERRIYRIDRLRLNPGGVPVRGVLYFLALLAAVQLWSRLPLLGTLVTALPWYLRYVALPVSSAMVLTLIRIEGRPAHLAVQALTRHRFARAMPAGLHARRRGERAQGTDAPGVRWWPDDVFVLPDGSDARIRRLRYTGPGAVLVTVAHERVRPTLPRPGGRTALIVRERSPRRVLDRGEVIALAAKTRLKIG